MALFAACFSNTAVGGVIYSNLNPDPTRVFNDAFLFIATDARPSHEN